MVGISCPFCLSKLDSLECYQQAWVKWDVWINDNGEICETQTPDYIDVVNGNGDKYVCPYCGEELCVEREDAIKILKGETK